MTAARTVVITCDGILSRGCRHGSVYSAETRSIRLAREEAHLFGWRVRWFTDAGSMVDVCRDCGME